MRHLLTAIGIALACCAAPSWATDTPTTFSVSRGTFHIQGGTFTPGSALYVFQDEHPDAQGVVHRSFYMREILTSNNVAGPGCAWSTDFTIGNYIECAADGVTTIKVDLGKNAENDFLFIRSTDPYTGQLQQWPGVTTLLVTSLSKLTYLGLEQAVDYKTLPMFPDLTYQLVKTKYPFVGR